ncbi:MAG: MBL fold metallo-hydrolase [Chloroflexi bacterium]|nr:MBL fold metallo-hydrolase [Chloroflexota bacterium]
MELTTDVFCYQWRGQANGCNSYAIRYLVNGVPRYALIDPGQRAVALPFFDSARGRMATARDDRVLETLLGSMKKDGIQPEEIGLIINTHCHPDHCEAAPELKKRTGAPIALHRGDKVLYAQAVGKRYNGDDDAGEAVTEPDIYLEEGDLRLGSPDPITLKVLHTPGHSPGSISLYWPERKTLIAGDVVFYRSFGRYDTYGGDLLTLKDSITRLSKLDVEYLLTGHPYGHPGIIKGKREVEANFRFILVNILG